MDRRRRPLRFSVGDRVFLRVSPMKGVMRFGRRGKLSPMYIGPFEILWTVGEVAYELALPPTFSAIHPVFHVSMLRRYVPDESHVLQYDAVELDDRLTFVEETVAILARDVRRLHSRAIPVVKPDLSKKKPHSEEFWILSIIPPLYIIAELDEDPYDDPDDPRDDHPLPL
ncbi:hypothetical protein MTR67_006798 [Solanum verrucosum]|uniref:Tf2-1-like SH3-like domain-containing protein n=1 Tax=Solanum verrucosum TaxID=315347 RepID=A0AAF0PZ00_SOLVR|nr:hypothetical protein MTR67_006798 [Solanum verrucosum]